MNLPHDYGTRPTPSQLIQHADGSAIAHLSYECWKCRRILAHGYDSLQIVGTYTRKKSNGIPQNIVQCRNCDERLTMKEYRFFTDSGRNEALLAWQQEVTQIEEEEEKELSGAATVAAEVTAMAEKVQKAHASAPATIRNFVPENEQGVVFIFGKLAGEHKYAPLKIGTRFPDAVFVGPDGIDVRVEFEYVASNFVLHGHKPEGADLVVCWNMGSVKTWERNQSYRPAVLELENGKFTPEYSGDYQLYARSGRLVQGDSAGV